MQLIKEWFQRYFSDPQVVILLIVLLVFSSIIFLFGRMLIPVLASIVIAYLLHSLVIKIQSFGLARMWAVSIVFVAFVAFLLFVLFYLLPLLSLQVSELVPKLPKMIDKVFTAIKSLPETYKFITVEQVNAVIDRLQKEMAGFGQTFFLSLPSSIPGLITLVVYLVLMPLLVFFFLKDKEIIIHWMTTFLPRDMTLTRKVWNDVDRQIGNYIRGKMVEILIVWIASYIAFALFGLNYAMLLGALVGLSVVIPYIGAVLVTIPVVFVAYFQWGWGADFGWLVAVYFIIQAIDGSVIVPVLFSEVVDLHPIAIIVAVLIFGGLWGFWGVFFAIPLATLVQAIVTAIRASHSVVTE